MGQRSERGVSLRSWRRQRECVCVCVCMEGWRERGRNIWSGSARFSHGRRIGPEEHRPTPIYRAPRSLCTVGLSASFLHVLGLGDYGRWILLRFPHFLSEGNSIDAAKAPEMIVELYLHSRWSWWEFKTAPLYYCYY